MALAIIGGTGLYQLDHLTIAEKRRIQTPYGETSAPIVCGAYDDMPVFFLARHGEQHQWPAHRVNYRANIHALMQFGVKQIISVNAVGGITSAMEPAALCVPDQIIDYSSGRIHTYSDDEISPLLHIDFSFPYTERMRQLLMDAGKAADLNITAHGVYGCTQGPRLETAAEIKRMKHDGCDVVGMTGMPEAALARELGIDYASLCLVVNWAAGCTSELITIEAITATLKAGMKNIHILLAHILSRHT
jgi:5'-methylthioinosine phosphorylase